MICDTDPATMVYATRLPSPSVIRGALAPRDPSKFDLDSLVPGLPLTRDVFDLPTLPDPSAMDPWTTPIDDVVRASPSRAYVQVPIGPWHGWWRVDTSLPAVPERTEIVGEISPVVGRQILAVIPATALRVDDLMYASGFPNCVTQVRVLDVCHMPDDGRGLSVLVRTKYGWFAWRHEFAHVANL